jgi:hypothetical protein
MDANGALDACTWLRISFGLSAPAYLIQAANKHEQIQILSVSIEYFHICSRFPILLQPSRLDGRLTM